MHQVSLGNVPPHAEIVIKITYVAELRIEGDEIVFQLPASLASSHREQALDTVCM